jgi:uncharacterized protein HemY
VTALLLALVVLLALLLCLLAIGPSNHRTRSSRRIDRVRRRQMAAIEADRRAAEDAMRRIVEGRWR